MSELIFVPVMTVRLFFLAVGGSRAEKDLAANHGVHQPQSAISLTVQGCKPAMQSKSAVRKNPTPRTAGKAVVPVNRRVTKIRNYNVKDDSFNSGPR